MTKNDIAVAVSGEYGISPALAENIVGTIIASIKNAVLAGSDVHFRGFGTFTTVHHQQRKGRNITRGTEVIIPERKVVKFRPSKKFRIA